MPYIKTDNWPVVLPQDDGIRPAGEPDQCFYCGQRVGQPHGAQCPCVQKRVRYAVEIEGQVVGTYEREEPYHWTAYDCEFHKNESSWCADNAVSSIQWVRGKRPGVVLKQRKGGCTCSLLHFRVEAVVDPGPLIYVREEEQRQDWFPDVTPPT